MRNLKCNIYPGDIIIDNLKTGSVFSGSLKSVLKGSRKEGSWEVRKIGSWEDED
jgi:hypothetical protein